MTEPSGQNRNISTSARRLAERYGVAPETMEDLIGKAYSDATEAGTALVEAAAPAIIPVVEQSTLATTPAEFIESRRFVSPVSAPIVIPPLDPITEQPVWDPYSTPVEDHEIVIRPVPASEPIHPPTLHDADQKHAKNISITNTPPLEAPPVVVPPAKKSELGSGLIWFVVILGILGVVALGALLMEKGCFEQEEQVEHISALRPAPIEVPAQQPETPKEDSTLLKAAAPPEDPAKPEAPVAKPKAAKVAHKGRPAATKTASSKGVMLSTSSNLDAQEKLADLRADGNTKAYIEAVKKHGHTVYRVHRSK